MIKIGIIGGSGLNKPEILKNEEEKEVETKFGKPSSKLKEGTISNTKVVILARHGVNHTIPPHKINYRANIEALKKEGCTHIIATTAVGSLKEEIRRGDLVIINQFIDFTKGRESTYYDEFEKEKPKHAMCAHPFNEKLRNTLIKECEKQKIPHHKKGTVITINGPRFSTRAESIMFKNFGADIINMSIATECALAKEKEIPYAAIAMSTDYDSWLETETPVTWEEVLKVFNENVEKVTNLIIKTIPKIEE